MRNKKEKLNKTEKTGQNSQNNNKIFQFTSIVLIVLLFVAILVQICIIVNLKNKTDELKKKLESLPPAIEQPDDQAEPSLQEIEIFETDL